MNKLATLLLGLAVPVMAQRAEQAVFRAVMSPANEVPAITGLNASGIAIIRAHYVRDRTGAVVSGSVDFTVSYSFPQGEITFTGLHIHRGAAGVNGGVVIDTRITGAAPVVDSTGTGVIERQAQAAPDSPLALPALRDLLADPGQFYVNLHTTVYPAGAIRGQLERAEAVTLMARMSPRNEVPAITTNDSSGLASITAIRTVDAQGRLTSAAVIFDVDHDLRGQATISGLHIHAAPAGVNGPVVIDTATSGLLTNATGTGAVLRPVEIDLNRAAAVDALNGLFSDPASYYVNLHTTQFPAGLVRGQLRRVDTIQIAVAMLPSNEVPPLTLDARADALITVNTLRNPDGTVATGRVEFDVNYRFPGDVTFTGLHLHNGAAGVNGPVRVDSNITRTNTVRSETGFGNITRAVKVDSADGLATLNTLLATPEDVYVNLHTEVNLGGAVRAQLGEPISDPPIVGAAVSHVLLPGLVNAAPGGLVAVFGRRFTTFESGLEGWEGPSLPLRLNGVEATVGGRPAPLLQVSPEMLYLQVPFETAEGSQPLVITRNGRTGAGFSITVDRYAPGIYLRGDYALALKIPSIEFAGPENPLAPNDTVRIYLTGMGQTTPTLATGALAGESNRTAAATVTLGGVNAPVTSSIAMPGQAGFYEVTFQVPAGAPSGNQNLVVEIGGVRSNTARLPVR